MRLRASHASHDCRSGTKGEVRQLISKCFVKANSRAESESGKGGEDSSQAVLRRTQCYHSDKPEFRCKFLVWICGSKRAKHTAGASSDEETCCPVVTSPTLEGLKSYMKASTKSSTTRSLSSTSTTASSSSASGSPTSSASTTA